MEERLSSLLAETGAKRQSAFRELLTPTEHMMLAKRLSMIFLISKEVPTHKISEVLRVSPSTVARFEVAYGRGVYKNLHIWLNSKNRGDKLFRLLIDILAVPFEAQHKSLSQMIAEREKREE